MKLETLIPYFCVVVLGLSQTVTYAETHNRHIRLTLNSGQLTDLQSGTLDIVELSTGLSESFNPAQLVGVDMLNIYVRFFDQEGNELYVVLRDLGGEYLNPKGWQWFQATLALDVGTVTGTYVNGWVFTDSLPRRPGNAACCTRSVVSQSVIESAGYGFNVTDSSIAIEGMRFQFNFNNFNDPVVITDGGGFDRFSLKIRSESIALVRIPQTTPAQGPYGDDGQPYDVDGDGVVSSGAGDQKIGIDFGAAQHFRYSVNVFPGIPNPADFAYPVFLADEFSLDPLGEENFDGCFDGICDGISENTSNSCTVTISGPAQKKTQIDPRYAVIQPSDPFVGSFCRYDIHIVTKAERKGRNASFAPTDCQTANVFVGGSINLLVDLSNGVQIHDNVAESLLPEGLTQQMTPFGCL